MTHSLYYPPADRSSQWFAPGSVTMPMTHVKWLQHTTETAGGWPSYTYAGVRGGSAPTFTYEPWQHKWRQHFPVNQSSRALQNDGSFYTNRADVVQTEISCYCDPTLYGKYGHSVLTLDDQALEDLADFAVWLHEEWGMDLHLISRPWPPYPQSLTGGRVTPAVFAAFSGILGHEHAPGNTHGDPGAINNTLIMDKIRKKMGGQLDGAPWPKLHTHSPKVLDVKKRMDNAGFDVGAIDDYYDFNLRNAVTQFQLQNDQLKGDADGLFGPLTWQLVEALPLPQTSKFHDNADVIAATKALDTAYANLVEHQHPLFASNLNKARQLLAKTGK